jgi:4-amino-4-deoxy-L-arabinose transferase-like glycosyltransferase
MIARSSVPLVVGLIVVVLVSSPVIFHRLGHASLQGDEAIYALTSRESVERDTLWPLYKPSGQLFPNKPPLKPMLVAACFKYLGESELSARLPDAIFGVLTISLVFLVGARRFGVGAGLVAATALLGAEKYLCMHGVRDSVMDSLLTLLAIVICCSWLNLREDRPQRRIWWALTASALVLAGLSKNVMGLALAAILVIVELSAPVWERRRSPALRPVVGVAAVAAVAFIAYFALMMWVSKGAFASFQYGDAIVRATRGVDPAHLHGPLFYPRMLIGDFGPWLLLALVCALVIFRGSPSGDQRDAAFLLVFAVILVGGFSLSASKLPWYIYPAYPALSLVIGYGAREVVRAHPSVVWQGATIMVILGVAAVDLNSAWTGVRRDVRVIDAERFTRRYSRLENASLIIDAPSIKRHGRLRSWNRYYLEGAPNARWFDRPPVALEKTGEGCIFVATGEPHSYPPTAALPWRPITKFRRLDKLAGTIWILGTCDLEVPWAQGVDEPLWNDLVHADDFETGDLQSWPQNQ